MVVQSSVTIAAGATTDVLVNNINAVVDPNSRGALVKFAYTSSAVGLTAAGWIGQRNVIEEGGVSTQNRMPIDPDDTVDRNLPARPNERIRLLVTNTTGGGLSFYYRVNVDEV